MPLPRLLLIDLYQDFREEYLSRCQQLLPLVSGIIIKESFAEDLFEYMAAEKKHFAGSQDSFCKGVDQCN